MFKLAKIISEKNWLKILNRTKIMLSAYGGLFLWLHIVHNVVLLANRT